MARGDSPILELMSDLPRLIMQYKMAEASGAREQERINVQQEQFKLNQEMNVLNHLISYHDDRASMFDSKTEDYLSKIDDIETDMMEYGGQGLIDTLDNIPDLYKSTTAVNAAIEFTDNSIETLQNLANYSKSRSFESKKESESAAEQYDYYKGVFGNISTIAKEAGDVSPDLGDISAKDVIDEDDMLAYFDKNIIYDATDPTITAADKIGKIASNDPNANYYRSLFGSWDPGFQDDLALEVNLKAKEKQDNEQLNLRLAKSYKSIAGSISSIFAAEELGDYKDWEKWKYILGENNQDIATGRFDAELKDPNLVAALNEILVEVGDGGIDWYRNILSNPDLQAAVEWLKMDPNFAYRFDYIESQWKEFGAGTLMDEIGVHMDIYRPEIENLLEGNPTNDDIVNQIDTWVDQNNLDRIEADWIYDLIIEQAEVRANDPENYTMSNEDRVRFLNLDAELVKTINIRQGDLAETILELEEEKESLETQLDLSGKAFRPEVYGQEVYEQTLENNRLIEEKISTIDNKIRQIQLDYTEGPVGLKQEESLLFDISSDGTRIASTDDIVNVLDRIELPESYIEEWFPDVFWNQYYSTDVTQDIEHFFGLTYYGGLEEHGIFFTPGLKEYRDKFVPHGEQQYDYRSVMSNAAFSIGMPSSYLGGGNFDVDGELNPYLTAFHEEGEKIWAALEGELSWLQHTGWSVGDPEYLGFLSGKTSPVDRILRVFENGHITEAQYDEYVMRMDKAGRETFEDRITEIMGDPSKYSKDYADLIRILKYADKKEYEWSELTSLEEAMQDLELAEYEEEFGTGEFKTVFDPRNPLSYAERQGAPEATGYELDVIEKNFQYDEILRDPASKDFDGDLVPDYYELLVKKNPNASEEDLRQMFYAYTQQVDLERMVDAANERNIAGIKSDIRDQYPHDILNPDLDVSYTGKQIREHEAAALAGYEPVTLNDITGELDIGTSYDDAVAALENAFERRQEEASYVYDPYQEYLSGGTYPTWPLTESDLYIHQLYFDKLNEHMEQDTPETERVLNEIRRTYEEQQERAEADPYYISEFYEAIKRGDIDWQTHPTFQRYLD